MNEAPDTSTVPSDTEPTDAQLEERVRRELTATEAASFAQTLEEMVPGITGLPEEEARGIMREIIHTRPDQVAHFRYRYAQNLARNVAHLKAQKKQAVQLVERLEKKETSRKKGKAQRAARKRQRTSNR